MTDSSSAVKRTAAFVRTAAWWYCTTCAKTNKLTDTLLALANMPDEIQQTCTACGKDSIVQLDKSYAIQEQRRSNQT